MYIYQCNTSSSSYLIFLDQVLHPLHVWKHDDPHPIHLPWPGHNPDPVHQPPDEPGQGDHSHYGDHTEHQDATTDTLKSWSMFGTDEGADEATHPAAEAREGKDGDDEDLENANENKSRISTTQVEPVHTQSTNKETQEKSSQLAFPFLHADLAMMIHVGLEALAACVVVEDDTLAVVAEVESDALGQVREGGESVFVNCSFVIYSGPWYREGKVEKKKN